MLLTVSIILFIVLETGNILILYFAPDSKLGNGVAVFNAWEKSKEDSNLHEFVKYMVFWVAGTKLIFIALLVVILLTGSTLTKMLSVFVLILSIASYFWKLHPIIKLLDLKNEITPIGYSKTLGKMIAGFMMMFMLALIGHLIFFRI